MKEPKQRRSQETLLRLRAAGLQLVSEAGPDALTVQDVAKRARSSVGSFYQRFEGKDEFLVDLWVHENAAAATEWETRIAEAAADGPDLACRLAELLKQAEAQRGATLRRLRDYLDRANLLPGVLAFSVRLAELVWDALRARAENLGHEQPDEVARILAAVLFLNIEVASERRAPYADLLSGVRCEHLDAVLQRTDGNVRRRAAEIFDVWDDSADADDPRGPFGAGF